MDQAAGATWTRQLAGGICAIRLGSHCPGSLLPPGIQPNMGDKRPLSIPIRASDTIEPSRPQSVVKATVAERSKGKATASGSEVVTGGG